MDIPGLDESNAGYPVIQYLKGNFKFCIYIFNSESFRDSKSIDIMKLIKEKCNIDFKNSLFILNKIDLKSDKEKSMREFRKFLMENFTDVIYDNSNSIISLDSIYLKYENLAELDITNLFMYYFKLYEIEIKDKKTIEGNEFIKLIQNTLSEIFKSTKKDKFKKFKEFCNSMSIKINANECPDIIKILNNLINKEKKKGIQIKIDLSDDNKNNDEEEEEDEDKKNKIKDIIYIRALYSCFMEKLIKFNNSSQKDELIDYFLKSKKLNKEKGILEEGIFDQKDKVLKERRDLMNRMVKFFNGQFKRLIPNDEDINNFIQKANKLISLFFIEEKLRIPILGCYNAGKSSIINSFIGEVLLPVEDDECTKIVVFIRYVNIQTPRLFRGNLIKENVGLNRYYLEKVHSLTQINGVKRIREFLQSKNDVRKYNNYKKDSDDNCLFFIL